MIAPYKLPLALGAASVLAIVISIVLLVKSTQTTTPITFSSDRAEASGSAMLTIDVEGAVTRPGVYTVPAGSRVEDAIAAAGGLSADADSALLAKTVNRAQKISDGVKIYIPIRGTDQTSHNISTGVVSVNFATLAELDGLPGVGPVTAQKIMDNRPYSSLDELVAKKAISASLYDKLKESLSL